MTDEQCIPAGIHFVYSSFVVLSLMFSDAGVFDGRRVRKYAIREIISDLFGLLIPLTLTPTDDSTSSLQSNAMVAVQCHHYLLFQFLVP